MREIIIIKQFGCQTERMPRRIIIICNHMLFFNGQNPFLFELLPIVTKLVFRPVTY
jgi:hypothetical protein